MISFSYQEKEDIVNAFNDLKLSYEDEINHKKVFMNKDSYNNRYNHVNMSKKNYMVIPKGGKCFVWFTYWKNKPVCITLPLCHYHSSSASFLQINKNNITIETVCFSQDLSLQTIFYGTLFNYKNNNNNYFTCENIFYYKGNLISKKYGILNKLLLMGNIFRNKEILQKSYVTPNFTIGLPVIKNDISCDDILSIANTLPYNIYAIKIFITDENHRSNNLYINIYNNQITKSSIPNKENLVSLKNTNNTNNTNNFTKKYNNKKDVIERYNTIQAIFKVSADIEEDKYNLFYDDPSNTYDNPCDIAFIPTYKKSVFMNKLFRNIKENKNLDLLEESDDEEEFENINIDKFVDINKYRFMRCVYNKRFKKWEPTEEIEEKNINKMNLITQKEFLQIKNSYK